MLEGKTSLVCITKGVSHIRVTGGGAVDRDRRKKHVPWQCQLRRVAARAAPRGPRAAVVGLEGCELALLTAQASELLEAAEAASRAAKHSARAA